MLSAVSRTVARADGSLDYSFEDYSETAGRVGVHAQAVLLSQDLGDEFKLSATAITDAIAGASPTGAPAPAGSTQVPFSILHDHRKAWDTTLSRQVGRVNVAAGYAQSREHDYTSKGWSLNTLTDFNQKNSTVLFGVAGHDDLAETFYDPQHDYVGVHSNSAILGFTQILDPKTTVTVNITESRDTGYLSDQYKVVEEDIRLLTGRIVSEDYPENRPSERNSGAAFISINHAITSWNGALEGSYRFYADTFGIDASTFEMKWLQKVGRSLVVAPDFRIYEQNAAKFYYYDLSTTDIIPTSVPNPSGPAYSSDYRLSSFYAITYGLNISWKVNDTVRLTVDYSRYNMRGRDGITPGSAYPEANIYSAGMRFSW